MQKFIEQRDLFTGEIYKDAALALIFPKRKNGFTKGWFAMAQNPAELIADGTLKLGYEATRVFLKVCARLDFENYIHIVQADAAKEMGLHPSHFNRALRKLVDEGIVLEGPKVGRLRTYRLDPAFGWKGSAKNHNKALSERMASKGIQVIQGGA
jgi:hypothetical protein